MPSATMAESSDSIAPSKANESASGSTACVLSEENGGKAGSGNELGMPPKRVPMDSTGSLSKNTSTEPVATAIRIAGQLGLKRLTPTIRPMVTRVTATAAGLMVEMAAPRPRSLATKSAGSFTPG